MKGRLHGVNDNTKTDKNGKNVWKHLLCVSLGQFSLQFVNKTARERILKSVLLSELHFTKLKLSKYTYMYEFYYVSEYICKYIILQNTLHVCAYK